ncbi:MAG TPA: hypothetical protein VET30_04420 [Pseudoxanthomonas sp.]|nr:hypothetical protein [Pseudoxanthomonas sp.]
MLIEVVVAFALLALALTFLLGSLSSAARQIRVADNAGRATMHAQSLLAQVGVGEALQPGRRQGNLDGGRYRWTLDVSPYVDPSRPPKVLIAPGAPRLLQVRLQMVWGDGPGEQLQWQTLRLAPGDINPSATPI